MIKPTAILGRHELPSSERDDCFAGSNQIQEIHSDYTKCSALELAGDTLSYSLRTSFVSQVNSREHNFEFHAELTRKMDTIAYTKPRVMFKTYQS